MKRTNKVTTIIIIFFLIIIIVVAGRTMVGNHFKKKFSKRPPPSLIVSKVIMKEFSDNIESFGTAIAKKNKTFRIEKNNLKSEINIKKFVNEGEIIIKLSDSDIIAPFSGIVGLRGITEDILGSEKSVILTLDDTSEVFVDLKIPENFATFIKKDLNVKAKFSGIKDKDFSGKVEGVASRVNAETRSILTRVKIDNPNYELIPGSLLEVTLSFNKRDSLSIPDTSIILEGNKSHVYKISEDNIAERLEIEIGSRNDGDVEVISGLNSGDVIVAEGLKKVRPNGKIKPIDK